MKATTEPRPRNARLSDETASKRAARGAASAGRRHAATARRLGVGVLAWMRLARVFHKVQQASVDHLREVGLSLGQFDVLVQVGSAEGATQQEVADALLVTKSNVCQLLDRMEEAGLVERRPRGRAKHLYLTPDGRRLYEDVVPAHERQVSKMFAALSPDEQAHLLRLLRTIDRGLS